MTHICANKLTIISSDNGLAPGRRQAIIWTNDGILLSGPLGTNFSEILIKIETFSFKKMHVKMSSGKWRPSCLGLNVLKPGLSQPRNQPLNDRRYNIIWDTYYSSTYILWVHNIKYAYVFTTMTS